MTAVLSLSVDEARGLLLAAVGPRAHQGDVNTLLSDMRQIQLDPIDRIGTNADLVAMARMDVRPGEVHEALGFEHFAKERCLLPPEAFPMYREQARLTPQWRSTERMKRVDVGLLAAVRDEVAARGPITSAELSDHGKVDPVDWHGWKSSSKAGTLALEVLVIRCEVVVTGRRGRKRVYDTPERALPQQASATSPSDFLSWSLRARVRAAGMLSTAAGPWWSMIKGARRGHALIEEGVVQRVTVGEEKRVYLVEPKALERAPILDEAMRVLGPLDPLIWNRSLVKLLFGFEYLWEVYKPAAQRRWGYYVMPLLHRGKFVGRMEARAKEGVLNVERVWREAAAGSFDEEAFRACVQRHAAMLSCEVAW